MHLDIGNSRLMRFPWRGRALVVIGVLALLVTGLSGCAQFGIPTAQTAPVEPGVSIDASTDAPLSAPATAAAPGPAITPPSSYVPPVEITAAQSPIELHSATVVRIVDGDTAVFRLEDGTQEKVRFIGIDTPESTTKIEPYGKAAAAYTAKRLKVGSRVYLEKDVEPRDRYRRLLAYVWLAPPSAVTESEIRAKQFNAMLAIDGHAQQMTIPPNVKYADYYRTFVDEARDARKGLWADEAGSGGSSGAGSNSAAAAVAPATPGASAGGAAYIGNRNTMKFHIPSCSSVDAMNPSNKVALSSRAKAISGGYVPCGRCRP